MEREPRSPVEPRTESASPRTALLTEHERTLLQRTGRTRTYAAGVVLFRLGDPGDSVYVIEEGTVEIQFEEGRPGKHMGAGEWFGELALLSGGSRRTASAVTVTPCRLRLLDQGTVSDLKDSEPRLLCSILQKTCAYLVASEQDLIVDLKQRNRDLERTLDYLRRTREELDGSELLANTDELTGLYNRRCLNAQLERFMERSVRTGSGLAVLSIDLDRFKLINDTWGHPAGDAVLVRTGAAIRQHVRSVDLPCRLGGDEFVVLLADTSADEARGLGEQLRATLAASPIHLPETTIRLELSMGGTLFSPPEEAGSLLARADEALYAAKRAGRGRMSWI